jgi:hypothetical protein
VPFYVAESEVAPAATSGYPLVASARIGGTN